MLLIEMNLDAFEGTVRVFESGEMDLTSCFGTWYALKAGVSGWQVFAEFIKSKQQKYT